jgi:hypothetical protein
MAVTKVQIMMNLSSKQTKYLNFYEFHSTSHRGHTNKTNVLNFMELKTLNEYQINYSIYYKTQLGYISEAQFEMIAAQNLPQLLLGDYHIGDDKHQLSQWQLWKLQHF